MDNNLTNFEFLSCALYNRQENKIYDTIEEINVDSSAECGQLNLAYVARKKYEKKKLKQTPVRT